MGSKSYGQKTRTKPFIRRTIDRYAMAQAKTAPPPPSAKIRATKSMIGTHKELPDGDE